MTRRSATLQRSAQSYKRGRLPALRRHRKCTNFLLRSSGQIIDFDRNGWKNNRPIKSSIFYSIHLA